MQCHQSLAQNACREDPEWPFAQQRKQFGHRLLGCRFSPGQWPTDSSHPRLGLSNKLKSLSLSDPLLLPAKYTRFKFCPRTVSVLPLPGLPKSGFTPFDSSLLILFSGLSGRYINGDQRSIQSFEQCGKEYFTNPYLLV